MHATSRRVSDIGKHVGQLANINARGTASGRRSAVSRRLRRRRQGRGVDRDGSDETTLRDEDRGDESVGVPSLNYGAEVPIPNFD